MFECKIPNCKLTNISRVPILALSKYLHLCKQLRASIIKHVQTKPCCSQHLVFKGRKHQLPSNYYYLQQQQFQQMDVRAAADGLSVISPLENDDRRVLIDSLCFTHGVTAMKDMRPQSPRLIHSRALLKWQAMGCV